MVLSSSSSSSTSRDSRGPRHQIVRPPPRQLEISPPYHHEQHGQRGRTHARHTDGDGAPFSGGGDGADKSGSRHGSETEGESGPGSRPSSRAGSHRRSDSYSSHDGASGSYSAAYSGRGGESGRACDGRARDGRSSSTSELLTPTSSSSQFGESAAAGPDSADCSLASGYTSASYSDVGPVYSDYSGSEGSSAGTPAEMMSVKQLLARITAELQLDVSAKPSDMQLAQAARDKLRLPYLPLNVEQEVVRMARTLGWQFRLREEWQRARDAALAQQQRAAARLADGMAQLRALLSRQDEAQAQRAQVIEAEEDAAVAQAVARWKATQPSQDRQTAQLTPRALLSRARERLALPSLDVSALPAEAFDDEARAVCANYGIHIVLAGDSSDSEETNAGTQTDGSETAAEGTTDTEQASSTASNVREAVQRLQARIDSAIGSSNLAVIRGVLYDAKHFEGGQATLGYERPLEHLKQYAKELAGESEAGVSTETETETDTGSTSEQTGTGDDSSASASELVGGGSVGRKGIDGISRQYDRAVRDMAAKLLYVQGSERQKLDPAKALRTSLLTVLPHTEEVDRLIARGLRPVEMGAALIGGNTLVSDAKERSTYVMSIRSVKYYFDISDKAELQGLLCRVRERHSAEAERKDHVKARRREILGEKLFPRFQRAMSLLLQSSELLDDADFRGSLRKNIEATLTEIYSQTQPNPERFQSLIADASPGMGALLREIHSAFVESKQRHRATKGAQFETTLQMLLDQAVSADERDPYGVVAAQEKLSRAIRLALVNETDDSKPVEEQLVVDERSVARYEQFLATAGASSVALLQSLRAMFLSDLKALEAESAKKAANADWLQRLWAGSRKAGPDKMHVESAETKEMRRIRKALVRGRRGGLVSQGGSSPTSSPRSPPALSDGGGMSPISERPWDEAAAASPTSVRSVARAISFQEQEAQGAEPTMVTMAEAMMQIRDRLNIAGVDIVQLGPVDTVTKARERLALPRIEITEANLEAEARLICLSMGIALEDAEHKERKKAQLYMAQRGRRAAVVQPAQGSPRAAQPGIVGWWRKTSRAKQQSKVWDCEGCGYRNAPGRWRCGMCGSRNEHLATVDTPVGAYTIGGAAEAAKSTAEHRVLASMQDLVDGVQQRAAQRQAERAARAKVLAEEVRADEPEAFTQTSVLDAAHRRQLVQEAAARTAHAVAEAEARASLPWGPQELAERVRAQLDASAEQRRCAMETATVVATEGGVGMAKGHQTLPELSPQSPLTPPSACAGDEGIQGADASHVLEGEIDKYRPPDSIAAAISLFESLDVHTEPTLRAKRRAGARRGKAELVRNSYMYSSQPRRHHNAQRGRPEMHATMRRGLAPSPYDARSTPFGRQLKPGLRKLARGRQRLHATF